MEGRLRARLVEPVVAAALRGRLVRESGRFTVRELLPRLGGGRPHAYRLRGPAQVTVHVEHGTPDGHTLAEIWHARVYDPPPEVEAVLATLAQPRVLDLGANVGMFAAWLSARLPGARLVAYEPDPRNAELLRRTLALNGARFGSWEIRLGAAGASDRDAAMLAGEYTTSRLGGDADGAALVVRCWDVLPELRDCDVLKVDVEGGEWEILQDPRFAACAARVVVLEAHGEGDPEARAAGLLQAAGYRTAVTHGAKPEAAPSVWGWRAT